MYFKNVYQQLTVVKILILVCGVMFTEAAKSQVKVGLDFGTLQENRSSTQLSSLGRTFYDVYLNVGFKKEFPLSLALGYLYINSVENYTDSTYTKMTSANPYLGLSYQFYKKSFTSFILTGVYSPYAKLDVSEAAGKESWDGTTMIAKFAASFNLSQKTKINVGLYYISESFSSRTSGSLTTKSAFNQSYLMPSLGVAFAF